MSGQDIVNARSSLFLVTMATGIVASHFGRVYENYREKQVAAKHRVIDEVEYRLSHSLEGLQGQYESIATKEQQKQDNTSAKLEGIKEKVDSLQEVVKSGIETEAEAKEIDGIIKEVLSEQAKINRREKLRGAFKKITEPIMGRPQAPEAWSPSAPAPQGEILSRMRRRSKDKEQPQETPETNQAGE